jgi:hypothetical protein
MVYNAFPFSVFDMYEGRSPAVATRILVLDGAGRTSELHRFDAFQCEPAAPQLEDIRSCGDAAVWGQISYVARDAQIYLDAHRKEVSSGEDVRVVARVWRLREQPGPSPYEDCELARCRAVRRAP